MLKCKSVLDLQDFDMPLVILTSCWQARRQREQISHVLQPRIPGCKYLNFNYIALISEESVWYNTQP